MTLLFLLPLLLLHDGHAERLPVAIEIAIYILLTLTIVAVIVMLMGAFAS